MILNVAMVIDPTKEVVELRPQGILQVVLTDVPTVKWDVENDMFALQMIRYEVFITDNVVRNRKGNFQVGPYVRGENVLQHHFWFRLNPQKKEILNQVLSPQGRELDLD